MAYMGKVKNGVVVLDGKRVLPEGTEVAVRPLKRKTDGNAKEAKPPRKLRGGLMKFAGAARGLPPDASRNVDHYLYGSGKQ